MVVRFRVSPVMTTSIPLRKKCRCQRTFDNGIIIPYNSVALQVLFDIFSKPLCQQQRQCHFQYVRQYIGKYTAAQNTHKSN